MGALQVNKIKFPEWRGTRQSSMRSSFSKHKIWVLTKYLPSANRAWSVRMTASSVNGPGRWIKSSISLDGIFGAIEYCRRPAECSRMLLWCCCWDCWSCCCCWNLTPGMAPLLILHGERTRGLMVGTTFSMMLWQLPNELAPLLLNPSRRSLSRPKPLWPLPALPALDESLRRGKVPPNWDGGLWSAENR